jgi:hypothetical protein
MKREYNAPRQFLLVSLCSLTILTCTPVAAQFFPGQPEGTEIQGEPAPDGFPAQPPRTDAIPPQQTEAPSFFPPSQSQIDDFGPLDQQAELEQELNAIQLQMLNDLNAFQRNDVDAFQPNSLNEFQLDAQRQEILDRNIFWGEMQDRPMVSPSAPRLTPQMDYQHYGSRYPGGYYGYPIWHPEHPNFSNQNRTPDFNGDTSDSP